MPPDVKLSKTQLLKATLVSLEQIKKTQDSQEVQLQAVRQQFVNWARILQQAIAAIHVLQRKGLLNDTEIKQEYEAILKAGQEATARRSVRSQGARANAVCSGNKQPRVLRAAGDNPGSGGDGTQKADANSSTGPGRDTERHDQESNRENTSTPAGLQDQADKSNATPGTGSNAG